MRKLAILAALAVVTYLPALRLPFIDDDYAEIPMAAGYFDTGWAPLWQNPNLRARSTNMLLDGAIDRLFGFTPAPFYAVSIVVQLLCVLLVYSLYAWREVIDESTAFWAACFFAVFEGHQEAVMWISGRNEALMFLFGMAALVCWLRFLYDRKPLYYLLAIVSFFLAAGSKESFVIFPVLMALPCLWPPQGTSRLRMLAGVAPFFAIALVYAGWTWLGRIAQPQYADNRFSLLAPWPLVILRSWWRLMFVWGLAALAVILWLGRAPDRRRAAIAIAWMLLTILPYSFLTYMPQIASRHTYLASAGLALLVGAAAARLQETHHRTLLAAAAALVLLVNVEIVWIKKMSQFRERAEPAVLLMDAAHDAASPITIRCIPFGDLVVESVLASKGARAVIPQNVTHDDHCFTIEYQSASGGPVTVDRKVRMERHGALY